MTTHLPAEAFVTAAYNVLLNRAPDAGGFSDHVAMLRNDKSGISVLRSLLSCAEFLQRRVLLSEIRIHECAGFRIAIPEGDRLQGSIVVEGTYEPYLLEPFREMCVGKRVLDIGANVGVFTVAAGLVTKERVIALDASPENAKLIAVNAALNGLDNVLVLPVAVSDRMEMATFLHCQETNKVIHPLELTIETLPIVDVVLALPLDDVVPSPVDIVKIDIEGREYRALLGADQILAAHPVMFVEFSPNFIRDGSGVEYPALLALFFDRGYRATILHRDMTREEVGQSSSRLFDAWTAYMQKGATHLDLMFR
jgi:FkbM family methyltransferase